MELLTRVAVARWPFGAAAPLNLMIDDLADVFVELPGYRRREKDWGHLLDGRDSAWRFVEDNLLAAFPELKISLYIPVNRRPLVEPAPAGSSYNAIDARTEMVEFLRRLDAHPRVECAYHGKDHFHGTGAARRQEWLGYGSVAEAVAETRRGIEIFERVFKRAPIGGKYPGYSSNEHSDEAVAACGFRWWCRRFNRGRVQSVDTDPAGLVPAFFAGDKVLDLPTTLAGNLLPPWLRSEVHKWPKRLLQRRRLRVAGREQIRQLLEAGAPLTVQEHIAPSRADAKRQGVNLQDDLSGLRWMLREACAAPVWHAHPSEIADHWRLREDTRVEADGRNALRLRPPATDMLADLHLSVGTGVEALVDPAGTRHAAASMNGQRIVVVPAAAGDYQIVEKTP